MKNLKRFAVAAVIALLTVAIAAFALVGCGISGENYTFEAEDAELGGDAKMEEGKHMWSGDLAEPGEELTQVGYMTSEGSSITFTVKAEKACKVEITVRAASATMHNGLFGGDGTFSVSEIDLATQKAFTLSVNGEELALSGKLPSSYSVTAEEFDWSQMGALFDSPLCNYVDIKVVAKLKSGENKIVIESTGYTEDEVAYGANFDKIIIKSPAKLS